MIKEHVRDLIERKIEHRFSMKMIKIVFRYLSNITEQKILPRVFKEIQGKFIEIICCGFVRFCCRKLMV